MWYKVQHHLKCVYSENKGLYIKQVINYILETQQTESNEKYYNTLK